MKDIDRFDEHANLNEPSEQDILRARQKKKKFKQAVRFLIKNFLYHAVTLILFSLFVERMIETELYHETGLEKNVLIIFGLLATVIHILIAGLELSGDGESRRAFCKLLDQRPFTPSLPLKVAGPELKVIAICHLAFQLPFTLFHHLLGFYYPIPTLIEKFYCMDAGWMELTGLGIVGALLHTIVFMLGTTALRYLVYLRWKKEKI
jgi:hypothetical protein